VTGPAVPQGSRAAQNAGPGAAGAGQAASSQPDAGQAPTGRAGAGQAVTGGAGASRASTARGGWLPYLLVLSCAVFGLAWIWAGGAHAAKGGTLALAGAMFVGALARLVLPESRIGMLASRKRFIDVATMAALGAALLAAGLLLPMTT
jgi:Protein of unknown function (DUF3017)